MQFYTLKLNKDGCVRNINVDVDVVRVKEVYNNELKEASKIAQIKGFRAGKAPLDLVDSHYKNEIRENTVKCIIKEGLRAVDEELSLKFIMFPEVDFKEFDENINFDFVVKGEVYPDIAPVEDFTYEVLEEVPETFVVYNILMRKMKELHLEEVDAVEINNVVTVKLGDQRLRLTILNENNEWLGRKKGEVINGALVDQVQRFNRSEVLSFYKDELKNELDDIYNKPYLVTQYAEQLLDKNKFEVPAKFLQNFSSVCLFFFADRNIYVKPEEIESEFKKVYTDDIIERLARVYLILTNFVDTQKLRYDIDLRAILEKHRIFASICPPHCYSIVENVNKTVLFMREALKNVALKKVKTWSIQPSDVMTHYPVLF